MSESILLQGVDLLVFGMGTVFVFLTVLVVATTLMSYLVTRFFPEPVQPHPVTPAPVVEEGPDPRVLAVIKAAIEQHKGR